MKLEEYLHQYVRITNDEGYSFDGYVAEFFRGENNETALVFRRMLNIVAE